MANRTTHVGVFLIDGPGTMSARKVNDSTIELTTKRDGKILTTITDTISKDGKTRTGTVTGTNAQGQKVNNTLYSPHSWP